MAKMHVHRVTTQTGSLTARKKRLVEAVGIPLPLRLLAPSGNDLSSRFHASYNQLRSLPRRTRRALQRQLARSTAAYDLPYKLQSDKTGRTLRHKLAWSLAGAALLLLLGQDVRAATITVNTTNPAFNPDGKCSLSEAIFNAETDTNLYGDCDNAGAGDDIINLPGGTHKITVPFIYNFVALPPVTTKITINGNGDKIQLSTSARPAIVIFSTPTGDLTLNNVKVSGGYYYLGGGILNMNNLTLNSSSVEKNLAILGGGIFNYGGTVTVQNSTITKNRADFGAGLYDYLGTTVIENSSAVSNNQANYFAGGINSFLGDVTITNSTIAGNKAGVGRNANYSGGGGIWSFGTLAIDTSVFSKNKLKAKVVAFGGGVDHVYGNATMTDSTVTGNNGTYGGGVYNSGTMTINNSTVSKNKVKGNKYAYSLGGGIDNIGGTLTLTNSTVSGNNSGAVGGGINNYGTLTVANSTITKNKAKFAGGGIFTGITGNTTLTRSLISGSKAATGSEVSDYFGNVTANGFNVFGFDNYSGVYGGVGPGVDDIVPGVGVKTNNILSPKLTDNGGPPTANGKANSTHALVPGSPAVDAAPCVLGTDQRGVARPQGPKCDIGAFELGP